ncbi:hypothetical protein KK062_29590 [Fulvivirgaceae bacterium PWU5]|uniref:Uncharacterized protein n=1 Tax=Dawidia cretensis TaxID=2782350 RepID=A0AAP2E5R2_9BACT|nr:hypothetical protein [Dawidia cretensis]MBT1712432.1 hypothetical protein [Dawidia cretensis]
MIFKDSDPKSQFFFTIFRADIKKTGYDYKIQFKPSSPLSIFGREQHVTSPNLNSALEDWVNIIREYNALKIFEDPILSQYEKGFQEFFNVVEENDETETYDLHQQLVLDGYLSTIYTIAESNDNKSPDASLLKEEIKYLKDHQTAFTKKKVRERLAKIFALARKNGPLLIKEFWDLGKKESMKQRETKDCNYSPIYS